MMKRLAQLTCLNLALILPLLTNAQEAGSAVPYRPTPAHMWEFGLHAGSAMSFGDIKPVANWGTGFHFRKAIDYVFSVRAEGFYGSLLQKDLVNGSSSSDIQTGSLQLVASINNLVWNSARHRRINLYAFAGGGLNRFEVTAQNVISPSLKSIAPKVQTHFDGGLGIAFRLSSRFNLGLESKALVIFGKDADLLDGVTREDDDVLGYGAVRLNFNLGNANTKAEPLYWVNPMDIIMQDITELKNRPSFDITDSDADGVIDLLDQDNATPLGVTVDTRGLPLDSDGDGIPNYQDDEPYFPVGGKNNPWQDGQPHQGSEEELMKRLEAESQNIVKGGGGITDWFLPNVHFNIDSYKIRYADYGTLASIAKVMKSNPSLKLVVTGFTDKTASDQYNLDLSFRRAKECIEHLVTVHGLPRSRFLLNYNGEDGPLVPSASSTLMNRRVEFRVATDDDLEMENPVPVTKKGGKKSGF